MLRYRLRTLLILMGVLPPVLAGVWWADWSDLGAALPILLLLGFMIVLALVAGIAVALVVDWSLDRVLKFVSRK